MEHQLLQLGEFGFEDLDDGAVGGEQVLACQPAEDAEQARCARGEQPHLSG